VSDFIVNIDETNAAQLLIEESQNRPVVVDIWSARSPASAEMTPILEKIATEYNGAFLLARINADEQAGIAQQLGARDLPTLLVIENGQPVDGAAGAQDESQIRQLLAKYLPKPWDGQLQQGLEAMQQGDFTAALAPLRQAWTESGKEYQITVAYVQALIECHRLDEAEAVLSEIRLADQDAAYEQLNAQLALKREAAKSPEVEALEQQLEANPDDMDVRHQLAVQYTNLGQFKEALEQLISILRQDIDHGEGATKKTLLDTIATLGKGDPLAAEYQRKLFSLLY
jgi:putative thioredoxin